MTLLAAPPLSASRDAWSGWGDDGRRQTTRLPLDIARSSRLLIFRLRDGHCRGRSVAWRGALYRGAVWRGSL